jgi:hypothetical protein
MAISPLLQADGGGGYSASTSAVNTGSTTALGLRHFGKNFNVLLNDAEAIEAGIITAAQIGGIDPTVPQDVTKPGSSATTPQTEGVVDPTGYKFNLPPHKWSLPIRPIEVDQRPTWYKGAAKAEPGSYVGQTSDTTNFHANRRGKIWFFNAAGEINKIDSSGSVASASSTNSKGVAEGTAGLIDGTVDRDWGFQFLWNPESVNVSVARNMDVTPSAADSLRVVSGVFPGQETVSLNIVLDRTNDFACLRGLGLGSDYSGAFSYYSGTAFGVQQNMQSQITDLMKFGTMADLEYLFKAINGGGVAGKQWQTLLGKTTANVGYLQPSLLGINLGADSTTNLSYVGWISNIGMNHTAFTQSMIPIRTSVTLSIECFSGSGISA